MSPSLQVNVGQHFPHLFPLLQIFCNTTTSKMADVVVDCVIETPHTEEELAKCRKEIRSRLKRILPEEWEFFYTLLVDDDFGILFFVLDSESGYLLTRQPLRCR